MKISPNWSWRVTRACRPRNFKITVSEWLDATKHPRFKRKLTDLVYQPIIELLAYLRENGFTNYIVSGGGIEFVRV